MKLQIGQCMHLKRQKVGFVLKREKLSDYVFLHFINPVTIMHKNKLVSLSANCCYIATKGAALYYKADRISMFHNFVHFDTDDRGELEMLGLPLDTPFFTDLQGDITLTVERMEWSKEAGEDASLIPAADIMFEELLRKLAVEIKTKTLSSGYTYEHIFNDLRTKLYIDPSAWSVSKMAEEAHLSRSHFTVKYKALFGVTPNIDKNSAALLVASKLLLTTDHSINKIGKMVGYTRSDYFINLFKGKYGVTPGEFRRNNTFPTALG